EGALGAEGYLEIADQKGDVERGEGVPPRAKHIQRPAITEKDRHLVLTHHQLRPEHDFARAAFRHAVHDLLASGVEVFDNFQNPAHPVKHGRPSFCVGPAANVLMEANTAY